MLRNRPDLVESWPDDEVARRWRLLFPRRRMADGTAESPTSLEIKEIASDPKLLATYRERLCDLSWFNRCLNEHIARHANAEDKCTGRFWEGRFKCVRLESPGAVLACSVYVDLNPVRAGTAKSLEESNFTSIQDRINALTRPGSAALGPRLISHEEVTYEGFSARSYLQLVEETGRMLVDKKHSLPADLVPILERLKIRPEGWLENARHQGQLFRRIIGPVELIKNFAAKRQKAWLQGCAAARLLFV